jgi:hypothetical protein
MCVFWAEVSKKRAFFRWKWLKNVRFFYVEVAEKNAFFGQKCLKNVRFSLGSV